MTDEHEPAQSQPAQSQPVQSQPADSSAATPGPTTTPPPAPPAQQRVPPHEHERELGVGFYLKLAALLFFIGYAIAFIVGNDKSISVDFVFATGRVSLIWTILLLLLVGVLAGALFAHLYRRHRRQKVRQP